MSTEFFNDQWRIPSNENQNKISNYSMEFDGSSATINFGNVNDFDTTDAFSGSCWVYYLGLNTDIILSKEAASGTFKGYALYLSANKLRFILCPSWNSDYFDVFTTTALTTNTWHHIAFTYDGSTNATGVKLYVNGVLQTTSYSGNATISGSISNSFPFQISGRGGSAANGVNGKIDQVSIFDYELSQDQVTQLGAEGYAFNFNGSTQAIDCGTGSRFDIDQITISAWVRLESGLTSLQVIGGVRNTNNGIITYMINHHGATGKFRFVINQSSDSAYKTVYANDDTVLNTWYHVVGVADGSNVKLYINGDLQTDQKTYDGTITSPTQNFNIGRQPSNPLYYWDGELSNISVFNTGLQESDVQTLYNNGKPSDISSLNPVAWYKLDDTATFNSGTSVWTIPDASTNSNTGLSVDMTSSNLIASDINGELVANPMITSPKPIAYYQLGDQSVSTGPTSDYLVPNNSLSNYVFNFIPNDYINLGTPFSFTQNLTVSFWIKSTQTATNTFIGKDINVSGGRNWMVMLYQNKVYFWTTSTGSLSSLKDIQSTVAGAVSDGEWHHIVCVNNQTNLTKQIYIDGVLDVTKNNGGLISTSSSPVQIGKRPSGSPYDGEMSNLALWNTALTGPQVETIYNNGAPNDISSLSPVAWYKLNASEVFNSTSTEWSVDNNVYPSVYKSSLNFNGSSNYIDCGNDSSLSPTSELSVSAWVNNTGVGTGTFPCIISNTSASANNGGFVLSKNSNKWKFYLDTTGSSGWAVAESNVTVVSNSWQHLCVTWDGSTVTMYLNGQPQTTTASASQIVYNADTETIIGEYAGSYFGGGISNTAIFNTSLTSTQVNTLYNNGTPEASISHSPVSWWKLDNITTGIQDSAGSNNGTNNGATEYAGFVNELAGESVGMDSSNLVVSDLQQTSGYSPYALDFDGIDDYLGITSTNFKGSAGTVSYSFWVKPETYGNPPGAQNFGYFINNSSTGGGIAYSEGGTSFGLTPGQMYLYNMTNAGVVATTTSTFIDENAWNHIVVVFNTGNIVQFYKNGILSSTLTSITSFDSTWDTIAGRRYPGGFNNPINGCLSNFSIFDTALTATQVTEIFNEGLPSNLNNFSGTAPVSWWQIGSNSSYNSNAWTCLDEIGTNNAVSVNMPNDAITNGVGYSASGLGTSSIDIIGDAPYSTANGLSENMDVLDRTTDVPS